MELLLEGSEDWSRGAGGKLQAETLRTPVEGTGLQGEKGSWALVL